MSEEIKGQKQLLKTTEDTCWITVTQCRLAQTTA